MTANAKTEQKEENDSCKILTPVGETIPSEGHHEINMDDES